MLSLSSFCLSALLPCSFVFAQSSASPSPQASTPPTSSTGTTPTTPAAATSSSTLVPLRFTPEELGLSLSNPFLDYSLSEKELAIIGVRSFRLKEVLLKKSLTEPTNGIGLYVQWGPETIKPTVIEVEDAEGKPLPEGKWSQSNVTNENMELILAKDVTSSVRVCASEVAENGKVRLCTPVIDPVTGTNPPPQDAQYVINGEKSNVAKKLTTEFKTPVTLVIEGTSGAKVETQTIAIPMQVFDLFETAQGDTEIIAYGAPPPDPVNWITPERGALWQHTIGDTRRFFSILLKKGESRLTSIGGAGVAFSYDIKFNRLPKNEYRIYALDPVAKSTYSSKTMIRLQPPSSGEIKSGQEAIAPDGNALLWTYASPQANEINRSRVTYSFKDRNGLDQNITQDHEVFRSFSNYLSARGGFSLTTKGRISMVSDFEYNYWFEKFLVDSSLTTRRVAISFGYLDTAQTSIPDSKYRISHFDFLYRITPGVTGWDETWGVMFGSTSFAYLTEPQVGFMGAGIFWSRSLPSWFNYLLGITEFFRRPKWIEIQAVNYFSSSSNEVDGSCSQVRATGRIELSKYTYFEGGWAIITSKYKRRLSNVEFAVGRGFLGFGYRF